MKNIWDVLRKHMVPGAIVFITFESYLSSKTTLRKQAEQLDLTKQELANLKAEQLKNTMVDAVNEAKVSSLSSRVSESYLDLNNWKTQIANANFKIKNHQFEAGENAEIIKRDLMFYQENANFIQKTLNTRSKELSRSALIESINKQDLFDFIWEFIEKYRFYLETLSLDKKVAIINIMGYIITLNALISIVLILAGNYLILYFNLETKYPWLSKLIKARSKLSKGYLWFYSIFLVVNIFIYIGLNLYILFI